MSHEQLPPLAPCPFCGGQVEIDDPDAHTREMGYCIECEPCYLRMWAFASEKPPALACRWNARLNAAALALLEACRSALGSIERYGSGACSDATQDLLETAIRLWQGGE